MTLYSLRRPSFSSIPLAHLVRGVIQQHCRLFPQSDLCGRRGLHHSCYHPHNVRQTTRQFVCVQEDSEEAETPRGI